MPDWKHKLAKKMIHKFLVKKLEQEKFYFVDNDFTDKEKKKIINISEKTTAFFLGVGAFISMFAILTFFERTQGFDFMVKAGLVMILGITLSAVTGD